MEKKSLALFDFDGTLIKSDSIIRYISFARQLKKITLWELVKVFVVTVLYLLHVLNEIKAKDAVMAFWRRMSPNDRERFDRAFARSLIPLMYPEGKRRIEQHKSEGKMIILVSASPENYMRYVGKFLHVDAVLATPLDQKGHPFDNCKGKQKLKRIDCWKQENNVIYDADTTVVYGDTPGDFFMMQRYGKGYLVNPSRKTMDEARERFDILHF